MGDARAYKGHMIQYRSSASVPSASDSTGDERDIPCGGRKYWAVINQNAIDSWCAAIMHRLKPRILKATRPIPSLL